MKTQRLPTNGDRVKTYALIFDKGDEVVDEIERFSRQEGLTGAEFRGIGAFSDVVLGYFDWKQKEYEEIPIDDQVEVLTLAGDVAFENGKPKVHAHVVVGDSRGDARGGHLLSGHVRPTLELVLRESPKTMQKIYDPDSGLALMDPSR